MSSWAILATGPSMSQAVADSVRGRLKVAAVSDAYKLAPWADLLVSADAAWWSLHPEALALPIPRWSSAPDFCKVPGVAQCLDLGTGSNSGLLACHLAVKHGATRLLLCGFDFRGTHFFGPHPKPLKNTTAIRFDHFRKQFETFRPRGVEILNCTPGSGLTAYPMKELSCALGLP